VTFGFLRWGRGSLGQHHSRMWAGDESHATTCARASTPRTPGATIHSLWPPQRVCAGGQAMSTHTYTHTKHTAITHSPLLVCAPAGLDRPCELEGWQAGPVCMRRLKRAPAHPASRAAPAATQCLAAASPGGVRRCCSDLNFFLMLANRSISTSRVRVRGAPCRSQRCTRMSSQRVDTGLSQLEKGAAGTLERDHS